MVTHKPSAQQETATTAKPKATITPVVYQTTRDSIRAAKLLASLTAA